ncbi:hypothetical protein FGC30_04320 [Streptococcus pyogenes]|nr:hypothetical protein FGC30_04320 [Streptococcus pyogenes]
MLRTGNTFFSGINAPFSTHGLLKPKKATPIRGGMTTKGIIPIIAENCFKTVGLLNTNKEFYQPRIHQPFKNT